MAVLTRLVLTAAVIIGAGPARLRAQEGTPALPEYVVKAGFLFNFAKYVEWPPDAFEKPETPISIGIVGADPFGDGLEKILKNKTVRNRSFTVLRFPDRSGLQRCHILFIPRSEREHLTAILRQIETWPVLTVGEDDGFSRAGGTTNILIEKERPRLEVNPDAAEKARLTIDAKLLKAAAIVRTAR